MQNTKINFCSSLWKWLHRKVRNSYRSGCAATVKEFQIASIWDCLDWSLPNRAMPVSKPQLRTRNCCFPSLGVSSAAGPSPAPHPNPVCPVHPPPQTSSSPGGAVEIPRLWPPPHAPSPQILKTRPLSLLPERRPPRSPTSHYPLTLAEEIMAVLRWPEAEVGDSWGPGLHFPEPSAALGLIYSPDGDVKKHTPGAPAQGQVEGGVPSRCTLVCGRTHDVLALSFGAALHLSSLSLKKSYYWLLTCSRCRKSDTTLQQANP